MTIRINRVVFWLIVIAVCFNLGLTMNLMQSVASLHRYQVAFEKQYNEDIGRLHMKIPTIYRFVDERTDPAEIIRRNKEHLMKQQASLKTRAIVTAYNDNVLECGKDDGITASGLLVRYGHVAMDGVPIGTPVHIDGLGDFVVTDRFGGGYGTGRVDVYLPSRGDAQRFGRQHREIFIQDD